MAHYSAVFSVAIVIGLIGQPAPSTQTSPCIHNDDRDVSSEAFREHGTKSGDFVLSLSVSRLVISVGSAIPIALKLEVTSDTEQAIFTNLPAGAYDVQVRNEQTGKTESFKGGYLSQISNVKLEHISLRCPSYEFADLSKRFDLQPGRYVIRAVRHPVKLISWNPYKAEPLASVVSNDVRLEVTP